MSKSKNPMASQLPMVSVCTPTFNRRPFIQNMFACFKHQDYPKDRIEWIIVDDGTDKIKDLIVASDIPEIRYFEVSEKMTLGAKRNYMHQFVRGSIIVYMDDDDYYPPERISHAVERLQSKPEAMCAGSSEIYVYFKGMNKMIQCGPYSEKHATAGTFAFRTEMLKDTKYEDEAALAEERSFLKDYTIPFVQLDPLKTILVFSHEHNTFDKRKMFDQQQDPRFFKESPKTVDTFIRHFKTSEASIKKFFMNDIDKLLDNYDPGKPEMKPDVLKQIKEIEAKREKMIEDAKAAQQAGAPIMLQQPGKDPIKLTSDQIVGIVNQQQEEIKKLTETNNQNKRFIELLQMKVKKFSQTGEAVTIEPSIMETAQYKDILTTNQDLQNKLIASTRDNAILNKEIQQLNETISKLNQVVADNIKTTPQEIPLSLNQKVTKGHPEVVSIDITGI